MKEPCAYLWNGTAHVSFELLTSSAQRLSMTPKPPGPLPGTNYNPPSYTSPNSMAIQFEDGANYANTVDVPEIVGGVWAGGRLLVNASTDAVIAHNSWHWSHGDGDIRLGIFSGDFSWSESHIQTDGNEFFLSGQTLAAGREYEGWLTFSDHFGGIASQNLWIEGAPPQDIYGELVVTSGHTRSAATSFAILAADFGGSSTVSTAEGETIAAALYADQGLNTLAVVTGGEASENLTLELSLTARTTAQETFLASDVFSLSGTEGEIILLELTYDESAAIALFGSEENVRLGWLDGTEHWVAAVDGNEGTGELAGFHLMSWQDFLAAHGGTFDAINMLGAHGTDIVNNTAWAVINHNSEFAAIQAIPEPGTSALISLGLSALLLRRRRGGTSPGIS